MTANELADFVEISKPNDKTHQAIATMLRQQQAEIEDLKNANRFIQNFAEEQHQRAVALESELDRIVELYTDKAIENEALKKEAALQRLSDFTQEVEAKYSDAWWKEVDEFNKQLKAQEK